MFKNNIIHLRLVGLLELAEKVSWNYQHFTTITDTEFNTVINRNVLLFQYKIKKKCATIPTY